jgi:hypothetical protein
MAMAHHAAYGQQKQRIEMSGEGVKSRYVQQHIIDVGDVPGHQLRVLEVHRVHAMPNVTIAGVKLLEEWHRGTSDYTNGRGAAHGYGTWVMEDGSKIFVEWTGNAESEPTASGARKGSFHGTTRIVGGTGKFATLRGHLSDAVEFDTDPKAGYSRNASRGECWFLE